MNRLQLETGLAEQSLPGQVLCGDRHVIKTVDARAVIAAVDGVGHGREAAVAAERAVDVISECSAQPIMSIFQQCHEQLRDARGVAMSLAVVDQRAHTLTWMGVGNVEGVLIAGAPSGEESREHLLLRGGLVGARLPELIPTVSKVSEGNMLVFATDGIRPEFPYAIRPSQDPQQLADDIMKRHWKGSDDALVLVVRFREAHL